MQHLPIVSMTLLSLLALTACGGGGGGGDPTPSGTPPSGGNTLPTASFSLTPTGGPTNTVIDVDAGASTDADGTITGYSWDWGDGSAADTGVTASHTYTAEGSYSLVLTVTDDDGETAIDTFVVTITAPGSNNLPTIPTIAPVSAAGPTVTISPGVNDPDGDTLTIAWSVDSGPVSIVDANVTDAATGESDLTFPVRGTYTLRITASDGTDTATNTVEVTLTSTETFGITGKVEDVDGGGNAAAATVDVELQWVPVTDTTILTLPTDNTGAFTFNDLLGDVADFKVRVPGS